MKSLRPFRRPFWREPALGFLLAVLGVGVTPSAAGEFEHPRLIAGSVLILAGAAVLVAWVFSGGTDARRATPSQAHGEQRCAQCGHDLTGNVSGICPECGKRTGETGCDPEQSTCSNQQTAR